VATKSGVRFVVGEVELWRVKPPPETLLGSAMFESELTESSMLDPDPAKYRLGLLFGINSRPGLDFILDYHRRSRLGFFAGLSYALNTDGTSRTGCVGQDSFICLEQTTIEDKWVARGGVSFTIGRK
jgi:hypothetical protein